MTLPLSKTLDPADLADLVEELAVVDECFTKDAEQHPMRRWEYALAIRAYDVWARGSHPDGAVYDVGGAGSPFYRMLNPVRVIDPKETKDLATYLMEGPQLGAAVFCLSVLEHVDDLDQFCYHLGCLVAPGGLLFLTMDYWDREGPDTAHFHWMRKRIFNDTTLRDLADSFTGTVDYAHGGRDFNLLGEVDWTYHGPQVYDYAFASLALQKRA